MNKTILKYALVKLLHNFFEKCTQTSSILLNVNRFVNNGFQVAYNFQDNSWWMWLSVQVPVFRRCWLIFHVDAISVLTKLPLISVIVTKPEAGVFLPSLHRYSHSSLSREGWITKASTRPLHSFAAVSSLTPLPSYLSGLLKPTASSWRPPLGRPPECRSLHVSVSRIPTD